MPAPVTQVDRASRTVRVDGLRTHYLDVGEGPTVVLLHDGSYGSSAKASWFGNIDALAASHRVLAPDWLGFGGTDKVHDFVGGRSRRLWHMTRFLEVMDVDHAAFVGVSMGGTLLLQVAASGEEPWPIAAVIALSGGGFVPDNEYRRRTLDFDCTREGMRSVLSAIVHDPKWLDDPDVVDRRYEAAIAPGAWEAVAAARFRSPITAPRTEFGSEDRTCYENIAVPVLLMAGAQDRLRLPGYADELATRIADSEVVVVDNCGHLPQIERRELVNKRILDFLARRFDGQPDGRDLGVRSGRAISHRAVSEKGL